VSDPHRPAIALIIATAAAALMFSVRHADDAKALLGPKARASVEVIGDAREAEAAAREQAQRVQAFTQPKGEGSGADRD
jgi:uncharacterized protein YqiB (DUF1249 family)